MGQQPNMIEDRKAIQERLKKLIAEHTQSDIARKTNTLPNKVHRYVHGAKVPAEFCAALTRAYGVNPAWLLLGEGASNVSEIADNVKASAKDVLNLVQALSAVAKMRLGALAGKQHLQALRELNEALDSYEQIKRELNTRTAPVLKDALDSAHKAIDKQDNDGASRFLEIARQVSRLCEDQELSMQFTHCESRFAYLSGLSRERTLELQRMLFRKRLFQTSELDERFLLDAAGLQAFLYTHGHLREACRVSNTALAYAGTTKELSKYRAYVHVSLAKCEMELGLLANARKRIAKYWPADIPEQGRLQLYSTILRKLVYTGQVTFQELSNYPRTDILCLRERLMLSLLSNDREIVGEVYEACMKSFGNSKDVPPWFASMAETCACIAGESETIPAALLNRSKDEPETIELSVDLFNREMRLALVYRLRGDAHAAKSRCMIAEQHRCSLRPGFELHMHVRMMHAMNAVALLKDSRTADAREAYAKAARFVTWAKKRGYACLNHVVL
ncbi:MAG: helix-turn-helix domain-containing protein [Planctomycetes bacterium]|nr:helix-turn-helix domain-containing protein [Planctomycetota bacterium]NUQ34395.1 hypothetical protein [Planctomycetaceae bacterium]